MRILILFLTFIGLSRSDTDCGVVKDPNGMISNPKYPYPAPPNTTCTWIFQPIIQARWLFLQIVEFDLSEGDYLIIEEKSRTHNFQGVKTPFVVIVDSNSNITFNTTNTSNNSVFHASFNNQECLSIITDTHGLVTSPIYAQRSIPEVFTCSWTISTAVIDKWMLFSFPQFELDNNDVSIYNRGDLVAKYTGNDIPKDVIVKGYSAKFEVLVNVYLPVVKLKAEFNVVSPECAKNVTVKDVMVLSEAVTTELVNCVWMLTSEPETTIMVKIAEMNLFNLQDIVVLSDGKSRYSPILRTIDLENKNISGSFVTSSSNYLYISFFSVPIIGLSNFKLNISAQTQGGTFHDHGEFSFKQTSSFNGQDVIFSLVVNSSLMVEVSVEASNLQETSEILFYDVQENNENLLTIFNKDTEFFPVFSKSNKVNVILRGFVGTEQLNGKFHSIGQGCDIFDQTNIGSYELKKDTNGNCTWLIKPSTLISGDMISLTFSKLKLNNKDIVAVYKGLSNTKKELVQVFNSQYRGQSQLYIEAKSGIRLDMQIESSEDMSQMITFYQLQGGCNSNFNISVGEKIQINSVGYPSHYLLNMNCEWQVHAAKNTTLFVNFVDVDIYADSHLQVYNIKNESEELIVSVNGKNYPDDIITITEQLIIKWNSTSHYESRPARGFSLNVRILECGANFTKPSDEFSTPGYPYPVNETVECIWGVAVPIAKLDSVNIIDFDIAETPSAENPTVFEIHDGGSLTSSIYSTQNNATSLSRTNKLIVRYLNRKGIGSGYKLSYSSKECTRNHQCRNGICMHDGWRCNGINDCGDFSDEENCDSFGQKPGVSMPWFAGGVVSALIVGVAFTILTPIAITRFRKWRLDRQPVGFLNLPEDTEEFE